MPRRGKSDDVQDYLFMQLATAARALGNGHRLKLLECLGQGDRSVEELADRTGLSIANASQHLQHLRRAGLVDSRRDGKRVVCRISDPAVVVLLSALRCVAERSLGEMQATVDGFFRQRDVMEAVSRDDLLDRLRDGTVTLIDVRPADEYASGHLPGALNIPLGELKRRLGSLRKGREVVAYCRGPYCVLAFKAVAALRKLGYRVRRLEDGFPEWKAAGLPVEGGDTRPGTD